MRREETKMNSDDSGDDDQFAAAAQRARYLWAGTVMAIVAAFGFSFKSIFVRLGFDAYGAHGLDAVTLMLMRFSLSAPVFLLLLWITEGAAGFRLSKREMIVFPLQGVIGFCGSMFFSFQAIAVLGASLATLIVFSYPALVILALGAIDRKLHWRQIFAALLSFGGLGLIVMPANGGAGSAPALDGNALGLGVLYGIAAAGCFAFYNVLTDRCLPGVSPVKMATGAITAATLFMTAGFGLREYPMIVGAWGIAGLLAIVSGVVPFLFFLYTIRRLGAGPVTIINLLGPAFNVLWAYLLFDESKTALQFAGIALIFAGVVSLRLNPLATLQILAARFRRPHVCERIAGK